MDLLEHVAPRLGSRVVVLLSGGRDSVCLLDCAVRAGSDVTALHFDFGLREEAAADAEFCRDLCERLGVPLRVERPRRPAGNLQAWARDRRYAVGVVLAREREADLATGHTATDQVETVLYRLAASPGRRALLGMRERDGRLLRPLLACTREQTAAHCRSRGLEWREDSSNDDSAFARNRIRHEVVPALRRVHPAAEANLLATLDLLRDEAEVLDAAVDAALADAGRRGSGGGVSAEALAALPPALRRLALQRMADAVAGADAPPVGSRVDEILALAPGGGTKSLDVGRGLRAVVVYGEVRLELAGTGSRPPDPPPVRLGIPGAAEFAGGRLTAELTPDGELDADRLGPEVEVRAWRPGDRMRPSGLGGTKSLQDLFTDRKVPRDVRARLPVVLARDEIAWIPGVATGEGFRAGDGTMRRARLAWVGSQPHDPRPGDRRDPRPG